jgi:hypothetical protein
MEKPTSLKKKPIHFRMGTRFQLRLCIVDYNNNGEGKKTQVNIINPFKSVFKSFDQGVSSCSKFAQHGW